MVEFPRIKRLPPYVFNITGELKMAARRRGEDIIDFGMGNPDQPTPAHIVEKMIEAANKIGLPFNPDLNGATQEGIGMSQVTIAKGRRQSTAFCYLDPARGRRGRLLRRPGREDRGLSHGRHRRRAPDGRADGSEPDSGARPRGGSPDRADS